MPSSIINSDDGVISGTSGLKSTGGDDGVLKIQNNGTDAITVADDGEVTFAAGLAIASPTVFPAGTASLPAITTTGDLNTGIYFPAADTIGFAEGGAEAMRIDSSANLQFNSGYGSVATAYGCRAWVNFNGTGTPAIREDGNVSSITDNGTGDYTVNFTTAMPDANYSATGSSSFIGTTNYVGPVAFNNNNGTGASVAPTTTALRTVVRNSSASPADPQYLYVAIFR